MESKASTYVRHRLMGMGSREAARAAGFETGVPGGHALELYRAAKAAQRGVPDDLLRRIEQVRTEIEEHQEQLSELKRLERARNILDDIELFGDRPERAS